MYQKEKIAILYCGLTRDFDRCFVSFKKNFIDKNPQYSCDIFVTVWDRTHDRVSNVEPELIKYDVYNLIRMFEPKSHYILNYRGLRKQFRREEFKYIYDSIGYNEEYGKEFISNSFLMQMYAMKKSFELFNNYLIKYKDESISHYKFIFKNRYDMFYEEPCILPKDTSCESLNILNIKKPDDFYGFADQIAIGGFDIMEKFMNSYNYLLDKNFLRKNKNYIKYPEHLFRLVMIENNINYLRSLDWQNVGKYK